MRALCDLARTHSSDGVLQLGDFRLLAALLRRRPLLEARQPPRGARCTDVYWIDGNNENPTALAVLDAGLDGFVEVADRCLYIPRGHRWTWRGVHFGALGGAFSIDWRDRTAGKS